MAGERAGGGPRQGSPEAVWTRLDNDRADKAVLSNRYLAEDLVRRFSPAGLAELLDFSTLREENPELIRGGLRARKPDVLWSVLPRDGGPRVDFPIRGAVLGGPLDGGPHARPVRGPGAQVHGGQERHAAVGGVLGGVQRRAGLDGQALAARAAAEAAEGPRAWQSATRYFLLDLRRFRGQEVETLLAIAGLIPKSQAASDVMDKIRSYQVCCGGTESSTEAKTTSRA